MSSKTNRKELTTFINSQAGVWLMDEINKMRHTHYEKGEATPENASLELAKAYGNNEVALWIKSMVASRKG